MPAFTFEKLSPPKAPTTTGQVPAPAKKPQRAWPRLFDRLLRRSAGRGVGGLSDAARRHARGRAD